MAAKTLSKVFVYGTLKKGEPNHQWFSKSTEGYYKFLYNGRTEERYPLIIATGYNIPFLLHAPGQGLHVMGEVYEVDKKVLANLDILEDHPNFYIRDQFSVQNIDNPEKQSEKVWIYMINSFKKDLLNQTVYDSYSNSGSHGLKYVETYLRGKTEDYKTDLFSKIEMK